MSQNIFTIETILEVMVILSHPLQLKIEVDTTGWSIIIVIKVFANKTLKIVFGS